MNNILLQLKRFDLGLQAAALIVPFLLSLLERQPMVIWSYFTVGGVQVLSALIHLAAGIGRHNRRRRRYEAALLCVFWAGVVAAVSACIPGLKGDLLLVYLMAMLVVGAVMAVYYFRLCVLEVKALKATRQQPL